MCNLEPSEKCYGCGYWASGDSEGCRMTIEFRKNNPYATAEEYRNYMLLKRRKKYKYDIQN